MNSDRNRIEFTAITDQIKEKIEEADYVLIGIGEEWDPTQSIAFLKKLEEWNFYLNKTDQPLKRQVLKDTLTKILLEDLHQSDETLAAYQSLRKLVEGKNYFLISTALDSCAAAVGFEMEKIVNPCGNRETFQCNQNCSENIWEENGFISEVRQGMREIEQGAVSDFDHIMVPVCPNCGAEAVYNHIEAESYVEAGYLAQWELYKKWLAGTLNRKIVLLELGVSFRFPTVIRFPFEKMAFLNQKAYMYRIQEKFSQITEEMHERGQGIAVNSVKLVLSCFSCNRKVHPI